MKHCIHPFPHHRRFSQRHIFLPSQVQVHSLSSVWDPHNLEPQHTRANPDQHTSASPSPRLCISVVTMPRTAVVVPRPSARPQHHASDRYAAAVAFYLSLSPPPPPSGHHQRIRVIAPVPRRLRPLVHGGSFRRGQLPEKITLGEFSRGRDTMRALLERKLVFFLTEGRKEEGVGYWMARWESFWQSFKRFIRRNESRGGMVERGGVYE